MICKLKFLFTLYTCISLSLLCIHVQANCYLTGANQLQVCHNPQDEGIYFRTPANRVAYNAQIVKLNNNSTYVTVFHSESRYGFENNVLRSGDSIRVGSTDGSFTYVMPPNNNYAIWGSSTDVPSMLYYGTNGPSGGGNPMLVQGRSWAGDGYYYLFFLCVHGGADSSSNNWRHFLDLARTADFRTYELFSMNTNGQPAWEPFTAATAYWQQRPLNLIDTSGSGINAMFADNQDATQGLIGSISIVNGIYYYFYTDYDPTKSFMLLYVRTAADVSAGWKSWSPAQQVTTTHLPIGTLIRVAKAKGMNRWAVLYGCMAPGTGVEDLCIQYTANLNVVGAGGISDLKIFDDDTGGHSPYFLGLVSVLCQGKLPSRGQQFFMTDVSGNLASPDQEPSLSRGGLLTWMDGSCAGPGPYGAPVFRAGWDVTTL